MSPKNLVIAIDGPAASGKSTTARLVARQLGYLYVDTGAMYRAVTLKVLRAGLEASNIREIEGLVRSTRVELAEKSGSLTVLLDGEDVTEQIRSREVTAAVSAISSIPAVREAMVREQRRMAKGQSIVLEGRDIGTVVFPGANLKVFLVAHIAERARRRQRELEAKGISASVRELQNEIEQRDLVDSTRRVSPLRRASDAIELDTSGMTIEEQVEFIVQKARERAKQSKGR